MTLKFKISLFISMLFTILFGVAAAIIIILFSDFRKDEFKQRLQEKALTSIKLLIDVKEVGNQLLKIIDQNTINKLYDEKTLIFDADYNLIYSSLDDTKINWTKADLDYLKKNKNFFKRDGNYEIYGVFYDTNQQDFYALISANDNFGKRNLQYLIYLVLVAYAVFTATAWILCFYTTKRLLQPLDFFHRNISTVNENNLDTRLSVNEKSNNEIELIGKEFNFLLHRLQEAYQKQKEFTAQASHEFRTPLARISAQLENQISAADDDEKPMLQATLQNINQLNELINSLLILSRVDNKQAGNAETCRLDETIYKSIEKVHAESPVFRAVLNIKNEDITEEMLLINGNPFLLENVFYNLLKNAGNYSDNHKAEITISISDRHVQVIVSNTGAGLTLEEQSKLFEPFMRGANSKNKAGLGLGLRIVQRILHHYNFSIRYQYVQGANQFIIIC